MSKGGKEGGRDGGKEEREGKHSTRMLKWPFYNSPKSLHATTSDLTVSETMGAIFIFTSVLWR